MIRKLKVLQTSKAVRWTMTLYRISLQTTMVIFYTIIIFNFIRTFRFSCVKYRRLFRKNINIKQLTICLDDAGSMILAKRPKRRKTEVELLFGKFYNHIYPWCRSQDCGWGEWGTWGRVPTDFFFCFP